MKRRQSLDANWVYALTEPLTRQYEEYNDDDDDGDDSYDNEDIMMQREQQEQQQGVGGENITATATTTTDTDTDTAPLSKEEGEEIPKINLFGGDESSLSIQIVPETSQNNIAFLQLSTIPKKSTSTSNSTSATTTATTTTTVHQRKSDDEKQQQQLQQQDDTVSSWKDLLGKSMHAGVSGGGGGGREEEEEKEEALLSNQSNIDNNNNNNNKTSNTRDHHQRHKEQRTSRRSMRQQQQHQQQHPRRRRSRSGDKMFSAKSLTENEPATTTKPSTTTTPSAAMTQRKVKSKENLQRLSKIKASGRMRSRSNEKLLKMMMATTTTDSKSNNKKDKIIPSSPTITTKATPSKSTSSKLLSSPQQQQQRTPMSTSPTSTQRRIKNSEHLVNMKGNDKLTLLDNRGRQRSRRRSKSNERLFGRTHSAVAALAATTTSTTSKDDQRPFRRRMSASPTRSSRQAMNGKPRRTKSIDLAALLNNKNKEKEKGVVISTQDLKWYKSGDAIKERQRRSLSPPKRTNSARLADMDALVRRSAAKNNNNNTKRYDHQMRGRRSTGKDRLSHSEHGAINKLNDTNTLQQRQSIRSVSGDNRLSQSEHGAKYNPVVISTQDLKWYKSGDADKAKQRRSLSPPKRTNSARQADRDAFMAASSNKPESSKRGRRPGHRPHVENHAEKERLSRSEHKETNLTRYETNNTLAMRSDHGVHRSDGKWYKSDDKVKDKQNMSLTPPKRTKSARQSSLVMSATRGNEDNDNISSARLVQSEHGHTGNTDNEIYNGTKSSKGTKEKIAAANIFYAALKSKEGR